MQISTSYASSAYSAASAAMSSSSTQDLESKMSADIVSAKDSDSNGTLSASELGVSSTQLAEFDTNGDGEVSAEELSAGLKAQKEKMQASMSNEMMQSGQMGMLQASMGQGMGQSKDMSDMDSKMSQNIFSEKDANNDGVLSTDELGVTADQLKSVDTDGDGVVSDSELTAALKTNRESMMAANGGQMPAPPSSNSGTSGSDSTQEKPSLDNLIAGLFGQNSSSSSSTSSSSASSTASSTTASTSTSSTSSSLADYLLRQKASSAYLNMDKLIADLFTGSESSQGVSASA